MQNTSSFVHVLDTPMDLSISHMNRNRNSHFTAPQMYARHFREGYELLESPAPGVPSHAATSRRATEQPQRRSSALESAYLRSFLKRMSDPR
jgi:hypothetical protein